VKNQLWQLSVTTSIEAEEAVAALLEDLFGQAPAIYTDADSQTAAVSVYCPKLHQSEAELRTRLRTGLRQIKNRGLNVAAAEVCLRRVRRSDWVESWKKHFQPLAIGGALLIKPSWSRRRPRAGQAVVVLDPGLSFGTGQHPTTAFCLERLVAARRLTRSQSLLDIGTGSGILAIAAAKLGYHPVRAFDVDPVAIRAAKANLIQNGVEGLVRLCRRDLNRLPLRAAERFEVICANLSSDLLVGQSKRILNRLKPSGTLILAGILKTQFAQVRRALARAGLKLVVARRVNEWQSGEFGG